MIATLMRFGAAARSQTLAVILAWGSVAGSALQFAVQLPIVLRLVKRLRIRRPDAIAANVREVMRNFVAGIRQPRGGADQRLCRSDARGLARRGRGEWRSANAQIIYMLPVSLFGMSVSAAELPAMSSAVGSEAEIGRVPAPPPESRTAPDRVLDRAVGHGVSRARRRHRGELYRPAFHHSGFASMSGEFSAARRLGCSQATLGRLYSSTYYALRDTRTPLRFAMVRVALTTGLGYIFALHLPRWLGIDPRLGRCRAYRVGGHRGMGRVHVCFAAR